MLNLVKTIIIILNIYSLNIKPRFKFSYKYISNIKFNSFRKVICLNNKKIFNTMKDACSYYNLNMGNLCDSINKEHRNFCGKDFETNEPLKWMYYEDYINEFGEVIKTA